VLPPRETTGAETDVVLAARRILFRKTNGSWTEFLAIGMDEQVLADPVIPSNWLALCLASKSATRILVYGHTKGAKPVLRIEIRIEGKCNPSVQFDGSLLTISDDLGHCAPMNLPMASRYGTSISKTFETMLKKLAFPRNPLAFSSNRYFSLSLEPLPQSLLRYYLATAHWNRGLVHVRRPSPASTGNLIVAIGVCLPARARVWVRYEETS
jgi:hypothetical protein